MTRRRGDQAASCQATLELAPELALGSANGAERSEALSHLDRCDSCRREVAALTAVADALLAVAPEIEPPVGFEVRVAERLRKRAGRPSRRLVLSLAGLGLLLAAAGAGLAATLGGPPAGQATSGRAEAALVAPSGGRGVAAIEGGARARLVMRVEGLSSDYWVSCVVTERDGVRLGLGRYFLRGGAGRWSVALPATLRPDEITSAELLGGGGAVLARAEFKTKGP